MYTTEYLKQIPEFKKQVNEIKDPLLKILMNHVVESLEELTTVVEKDLTELDKRIKEME